jgi:hypothetical protein
MRFPPAARPGESGVLRVPVFRHGWCTGLIHLDADQISQRVAHLLGDGFQLGAGFGLGPVLVCGNRLGEDLLLLPQFLDRQCLGVEVSRWAVVS